MKLTEAAINRIYEHALNEYPDECCGIITGNNTRQSVHRCRNIQNRMHAEDPAQYPRDARTAYLIDRREFDRIVSSAKENGEGILVFYHSHTDHDAYFSEEDQAAQTVFGEPEFPDVLHLVVSVMGGVIQNLKCFRWDGERKTFTAAQDFR